MVHRFFPYKISSGSSLFNWFLRTPSVSFKDVKNLLVIFNYRKKPFGELFDM